MVKKTDTLSIRLTPETRARLEKAQSTLPYSPTMTSIVERGIILALKELDALAATIREKES